jgi:plastocyanin
MRQTNNDRDHSAGKADGVDRRGFLKCMAWAGTGLVWKVAGGVPVSRLIAGGPRAAGEIGNLTFVQISDSHIGFDKGANPDVTATFQAAIDNINALPAEPDFILHTGDLSHLSEPSQFDTLDQVLKGAKRKQVFYVPGEHDVALDNGRLFLQRYGKGTQGGGWHSFDHKGVHFVGLVNVLNLKAGGLGLLGHQQLEWLERDLQAHSSSTPVVVFAHIPLWAVYPQWGWGTEDSAQALSCLRRFGSVTVLNGHIHQIMQKVEGNLTFHTALSTAFPQPVPGTAQAPGPLKLPAEQLRKVLGLAHVHFLAGEHHLAVVDSTLAGTRAANVTEILRKAAETSSAAAGSAGAKSRAAGASGVVAAAIGNFSFAPRAISVKVGATVEWTNQDDTPHTVTSDNDVFSSPLMDTKQTFRHTFDSAGSFSYHCKLHPTMTGTVAVS